MVRGVKSDGRSVRSFLGVSFLAAVMLLAGMPQGIAADLAASKTCPTCLEDGTRTVKKGGIFYLVDKAGKKSPAEEGKYQTQDGTVYVVGANGTIKSKTPGDKQGQVSSTYGVGKGAPGKGGTSKAIDFGPSRSKDSTIKPSNDGMPKP